MSSVTDVADRIFAAIEAGDVDAVAAIYADDGGAATAAFAPA